MNSLNSARLVNAGYDRKNIPDAQVNFLVDAYKNLFNNLTPLERAKTQYGLALGASSINIYLPQISSPKVDKIQVTSNGQLRDALSVTPNALATQLDTVAIDAYFSNLDEILKEYNDYNPDKSGEVMKRKEVDFFILPIGSQGAVIPTPQLYLFEAANSPPLVIVNPPNTSKLLNNGIFVSQSNHLFTEFNPPDDIAFKLVEAGPYTEMTHAMTADPSRPNPRQSIEDRGNSIGIFYWALTKGYSYEQYMNLLKDISQLPNRLKVPDVITYHQFSESFYNNLRQRNLKPFVKKRN